MTYIYMSTFEFFDTCVFKDNLYLCDFVIQCLTHKVVVARKLTLERLKGHFLFKVLSADVNYFLSPLLNYISDVTIENSPSDKNLFVYL